MRTVPPLTAAQRTQLLHRVRIAALLDAMDDGAPYCLRWWRTAKNHKLMAAFVYEPTGEVMLTTGVDALSETMRARFRGRPACARRR